jgi:putative salt-induced outer membrane protein YdiY
MNLDATTQTSSAQNIPTQNIPAQISPGVNANAAPYVVPSDPSAARTNPYFELAGKNENAPLQMTVPYVGSNPNPTIAFAPPANATKPEPKAPVRISAPQPLQTQPSQTQITPKPLSSPIAEPTSPQPTPKQSVEELPGLAGGAAAETTAGATPPTAPDSFAPTVSENAVAAEAVVEAAPLQEEVIRWYEYPRKWMRGWDSHAELGLDGSSGNSDTLALQSGLELKRKTALQTFAIDVDYRQASSRNVTTEDNGRLNIDYDRLLKGTPWSTFGKLGIEWDKFKPFDLRLNLNGGVGYYWVRQDDANLVTRFGSGASREFGATDDDWLAEAVFGIDADKQVNSRNKLKAKVDYFPAWEDFSNYRLVADFAWEILLDDSENLSLKLAATDRYDSTPQGAEPNDVYYSLLLLYKF